MVNKTAFINVFASLSDKRKQWNREEAYTQDALNFLASIIDIEGMEDQTGLSSKFFQMIKYNDGMAGLAKWNGEYVMCQCKWFGLPTKNMKPKYVIATFWLDEQIYTETMEVGKDIVILYNNEMLTPEFDAFRVADALADGDNSLRLNVKYSRYLPIFKARNEKEKEIFDSTVKAMDTGAQSLVWGDEVVADEYLQGTEREPVLNVTNVQNADKIQYLMEYHDNLLRFFYNKYGLYTSGNAKHAQQSKMEIDNGESASWVYPFLFLDETDRFCKEANSIFGLSLEAHLSDLHSLLWQKFITQHAPTEATSITNDTVTDIVENGVNDIGTIPPEKDNDEKEGEEDEKTV